MIEQVRLLNFQAHASRTITLQPGLNVIVGSSDTGKSTVIRAIRWVALHTPATRLTRHGETVLRAGLQVDGRKIVRFKDNKEYGYSVNGNKYLAVGAEQPIPVKEAIQLSDINFQQQHDPAYLISLPPGQAAKEINRIVDLGSIDQCQTYLKSATAKTKTLYEAAEATVKAHDAELDATEWVAKASSEATALKQSHAILDGLYKRIDAVGLAVGEVFAADVAIERMEPYCTALDDYLTQATMAKSTMHRMAGRIAELSGILRDLTQTSDLDAYAGYVDAIASVAQQQSAVADSARRSRGVWEILRGLDAAKKEFIEIKVASDAIMRILKMKQERDAKAMASRTLFSLLAGLKEAQLDVTLATKTVEDIARKLGEICPACGKPRNR